MYKVLCLVACLAVASSQYLKPADEEYDPNPSYSFNYDVQDPLTGDSKSQRESRQGDVVQGMYTLIEADGSRRVVEYNADPVNGFNAEVRKEGVGADARMLAPKPIVKGSPIDLAARPVPLAKSPLAYAQAPFAYPNAPVDYARSPLGYTRSPLDFARSPLDYTRSPLDYTRSPLDYARSPAAYARTPAAYAHLPAAYAHSPAAAYAHVPAAYAHSPAAYARSPALVRSSLTTPYASYDF